MVKLLKLYHKHFLIGIISSLSLFLVVSNYSYSANTIQEKNEKLQFFQPLINKLVAAGVNKEFLINLISDPNTKFDDTYAQIRVSPSKKINTSATDYADNINDRSIKKTKEFVQANLTSLKKAEQKFLVPKEVIASVLWIETRHGGFLGKNHLPTVFLSTAMANMPEFLNKNLTALKETFDGDSTELKELLDKVKSRSEKKAEWAYNEIKALEELSKKSPTPLNQLYGSFSGAFGISQFLPSSYLKWAVDGDNDGTINLFELDDAIFSVANYLKTNGWGTAVEDKRKAVFHYNNSNAYVDAVLKLADKVKR